MVKTGAGGAEAAAAAIRSLPTVTEAHVVAGDYDLVAEVAADEVWEVLDTAATAIGGVDGVTDTRTYVAMSD